MILQKFDGTLLFRVQAEDNTYVDYLLSHGDLCVTITDEDAFFYEGEKGKLSRLDYAPVTAGN
jgi:hypothetical protein